MISPITDIVANLIDTGLTEAEAEQETLEALGLDVATVGGLFLSHSEQLPNEGEKITIDGLEITVLDIEGRRIDSVVVKKIAKK